MVYHFIESNVVVMEKIQPCHSSLGTIQERQAILSAISRGEQTPFHFIWLHLASLRCALDEKSVMESFSPKNPQQHSFKKARIGENE